MTLLHALLLVAREQLVKFIRILKSTDKNISVEVILSIPVLFDAPIENFGESRQSALFSRRKQ